MLLTPVWLWCNATAPDLFQFKGKMKPSVCVWAFLLLNSTRKYIKTSGPYQTVSFTSQKPEQCIKWQKILQLNKTLNFFCFFRAWLFSDPLSAKHGAPSLCAIAVCTNRTSCKTGEPLALHSEDTVIETGSGDVWLWSLTSPITASLSHSNRNGHGVMSTPWSLYGRSQITSQSARLKGKGCVYHKTVLQQLYPCCWAPSSLQCSSLICRTEKAQHLAFYSFLCRIFLIWAEMSGEKS